MVDNKTRSIFCSYEYGDKEHKDKLKEWGENGRLGNDVIIVYETQDKRQGGKKAVRNYLSPKLKGCSDMIVLIGNNTHNAPGVEYEIAHAKSDHKRIIPVRIPETTGAPPKAIRQKRLFAFEPNAIKKALNKK